MDKKGVSEVVSTVLMILLVIAAIVVLGLVLSNFISKGTEEVSQTSDCLSTILRIKDAYPHATDQKITVVIERVQGNGELDKLKVYINGKSYDQASALAIGEYDTYNVDVPQNTQSYVGKNIEVAAVFNEKVCPQKSISFKIRSLPTS